MKLLLLLLTAATVSAVEHRATANLTDPTGNSKVVGRLTLVQTDEGPVTVTGVITGLGNSTLHGFHVHEKSDIAANCTGAGGHYNPHNVKHGAPTDPIRHVGDLGNVQADSNGIANFTIIDKIIKLTGPLTIINRSFVIHADKDDLGTGGFEDSLTTGHAGNRLACGIIVSSGSTSLYISWTLVVLLSVASWVH